MKGMINAFFRKGFFIILFIAGCASYVNTVKIDDATTAKLRSEVTVYDSKKMSGLEYKVVRQIQATSCSSRENAIDQLRYIAHSAGANGITKINCGRLLGPSLAQNCWNTVMCEAVAIKVGTERAEEAAPVQAAAEKIEESGKINVMSQSAGFTLGKLPLVVTSYDAVGKSGDIEIIFSGNYITKGKVIKRDEENNLAIITFEEFRRVPVGFQIFPSYKVKSGQDIYVIGHIAGSQSGEKLSIAKGVISSTEGPGGDSRYFGIAMQNNPVYGGSPLLDAQGRVIGIVSPALRKTSAAGIEETVPNVVNLALKSILLLNLYPEIEGLVNSENESRISPEQMLETYSSSVVTVIAK
jgi:S1-C subfamily serine protease